MNKAQHVCVRIPFPSGALAEIALRSLQPDGEVKPDQVSRMLSLDDCNLVVDFESSSVRNARVSLQAFFDNVEVIIRAMDELGSL